MAEYPSLYADLTGKVAPATSQWRQLDALREEHRFFWNTYGDGYWVLTRHEDIRKAFHSPEILCNHSITPTDPDPAYRFLPSFLEPPEHMKYRHVLNGWFAPQAVERFRPAIARLAGEIVESLAPRRACEFTSAFGDQFPVKSFLTVVGVPLDGAEFLVAQVQRRGSNSRPMAAWGEMAAFWSELIAERKRHPADPEVDFITHLLRARIDGEPLPEKDINDICVTFTIGSLGTLKSQLSWCFYHLATHPDDRRRVVEHPDLVPIAVEEFLRAYPVVSMARKVTQDVDFLGCPMKKDQMVLLTIQMATRDPRIFPDADKVIIDRDPNHHIAFGASAHRCIGSHLARAQLQTAILEWHHRIPDYQVATDEPLMEQAATLLELPLAWTPPSPGEESPYPPRGAAQERRS